MFTLGKSGKRENILVSDEEMNAEFYKVNRGGDVTFHGPGQLVVYPILDLDSLQIGLAQYIFRLEETVIESLKEYGLNGERIEDAAGIWIKGNTKYEIRNTKCETRNTKYEIRNTKQEIPNTKYQIPNTKQEIRNTKYQIPNTKYEIRNTNEEINKVDRKICAIGVKASRNITMHGIAININTDLSYFNKILACGLQGKETTSLQKELGKEIAIKDYKQLFLSTFKKVFRT